MAFEEKDYLQLSGLQHFSFCRRQWALIHVEKQWEENIRTVEGKHFHKRAHDARFRERRGDVLIVRGISCSSKELGVSGQCDVLEMHKTCDTENGIEIRGCEGLWVPYPVEYKKGSSKQFDADRLQLCCQAMCLEEMLACDIPEGSLFYGKTRRRERVQFTDGLRGQVAAMLDEMRRLYDRGYTPRAKPTKGCNACSLKEICLPRLNKLPKVSAYIARVTGEDAL